METKSDVPEFMYDSAQRPIALVGGIAGVAVAVLHVANHMVLDGTSLSAALFVPHHLMLVGLSAAMVLTGSRDTETARLTQVLIIYVAAIPAAADARGLVTIPLVLLASGLAFQYRLLDGRMQLIAIPFLALYLGVLTVALVRNSGQSVLLIAPILLTAVVVGFLYYRFLDSVRRERNELQHTLGEQEQRLEHKDTLFRELHHRTKNNLQLVSSVLNIEANRVTDPGVHSVLANGRSRVQALALVHEHLYKSGEITHVDLGDYADHLLRGMWRRLAPPEIHLESSFAEGVRAAIGFAIPFGLVINELVFNCLEHAFPEGGDGRVTVHVTESETGVRLEVTDNGVGLPEDIDPHRPTTTGFEILAGLVHQIHGEFRVSREGGTAWQVDIPRSSLTFTKGGE